MVLQTRVRHLQKQRKEFVRCWLLKPRAIELNPLVNHALLVGTRAVETLIIADAGHVLGDGIALKERTCDKMRKAKDQS